jgi:hypothetical protein
MEKTIRMIPMSTTLLKSKIMVGPFMEKRQSIQICRKSPLIPPIPTLLHTNWPTSLHIGPLIQSQIIQRTTLTPIL